MLAARYRVEQRLAIGGMGAVYVGVDERLGRPVAVKLLKEELAGQPDFVERFRREARAAAGLSHPNVAQVYDYGQDGQQHFIVMELVEGTDLARLLRERGRLWPSEAVRIATQVCLALSAAHAGGIVHRDLKPGNVIICPDGMVKVTDFGIARAAGHSSLTQTGTVMGTAQYLRPEQATGSRRARRRTCTRWAWCCSRWSRAVCRSPVTRRWRSRCGTCTKAFPDPASSTPRCRRDWTRLLPAPPPRTPLSDSPTPTRWPQR
jgi:serine/threonine protein kinase